LFPCVKLLTTESNIILIKFMGDSRMKKILPLLMLIGVVLASGCVGQTTTTTTGTNGLIISDFSPDASNLMAGDSVNLNLEVQNVGGAKASNIKFDLYGVTFGTGNYDWALTGESSYTLPSPLMPPEEGISGEMSTYVWTIKSPSGIKSDTTYPFDVRVEYNYSTDVTGTLTFVSKDYWNSLSKTEKEALASKAGISQLTQTGGPISITLYAGQRTRPFVVDTEQAQYIMRVTVNNIGSGEPRDVIKLLPEEGSTGIMISCPDAAKTDGVKLSRGKTASFSCTLTLSNPEKIVNKQDFTIALGFSYGWRVDSSTEITVQRPLT
jgi:hypothetical protein